MSEKDHGLNSSSKKNHPLYQSTTALKGGLKVGSTASKADRLSTLDSTARGAGPAADDMVVVGKARSLSV